MTSYVVTQSPNLSGEVQINTAKNAVLPILAASLLTDEPLSIHRVPNLTDVQTLIHILRDCGANLTESGGTVTAFAENPHNPNDEESIRRMRASVLVMGPLLARTGHARVALPGGCAIGQRPIDLHVKGMQALGADVELSSGSVTLKGKLKGGNVYLDLPSVGATENILMAATLAEGVTRIENVAKEPEIVDLADCLTAMGAKIMGAGSGTIWVEGVKKLNGCSYQPISDRIEAGTLACAAAITRGSVLLQGARAEHMRAVLFKLQEAGVQIRESRSGLRIMGHATHPFELRTLSYPGFPTDMQAPMMAVALAVKGTSVFLETIFENRFMHAQELKRMGARIRVENRVAIIEGGSPLLGATVTCTDLRAGAALVLAGLIAQGETTILDPHGSIPRGYADLPEKLQKLGAKVEKRETEEKV
jgi:UDP-N-acetylglucosamine 1-carboxyvinyltransferase